MKTICFILIILFLASYFRAIEENRAEMDTESRRAEEKLELIREVFNKNTEEARRRMHEISSPRPIN